MKKISYSFASLMMGCCMLLSSCGTLTTGSSTTGTTRTAAKANTTATTTKSSSNTSSTVQAAATLASALLANSTTSNSTASTAATVANAALSSINNGSLISGVIGLLTGNTTSAASIVGTWTYAEPTVQFESSNLLAQAGGVVVGQTLVSKLTPYYEKVGIKAGTLKMAFTSSNSCTITYGSTSIPMTYTYDASSHVLNLKGQFGLISLTGYATVSLNQLAVTFESSKLLSLISTLGASSNNSTLNSVSSLVNNYSGMKTGFLLTK